LPALRVARWLILFFTARGRRCPVSGARPAAFLLVFSVFVTQINDFSRVTTLCRGQTITGLLSPQYAETAPNKK
jgi:hypothetical protein